MQAGFKAVNDCIRKTVYKETISSMNSPYPQGSWGVIYTFDGFSQSGFRDKGQLMKTPGYWGTSFVEDNTVFFLEKIRDSIYVEKTICIISAVCVLAPHSSAWFRL
jgi:hypothetical protein